LNLRLRQLSALRGSLLRIGLATKQQCKYYHNYVR
jgi:hypothetical protein